MKNILVKIGSGLFLAALSVALVGCGDKKPDDKGGAAPAEKKKDKEP